MQKNRVFDKVRNPQINERFNYIDICKAVGIILVVLGHTYHLPDDVYLLIYSFHMPLFFILAGFVYNKEKNEKIGFKKFVFKQFKYYLIPYFVFSFVNLIIEILWSVLLKKQLLGFDYFTTKIKGILLCYSNMDNMPNCSPIWFLLCLFVASLIFWWIMKTDIRFRVSLVFLCLLINYLVMPYCTDYTSFPFKFPVFLMAVFFLFVGYSLKMLITNYYWINKWYITLCAIASTILCLMIVYITKNSGGMNENHYNNYMVYLVISVLISCGLIIFIKKISVISVVNNRFMLWLGCNTIYIVGFSYICRDVANEIYYFTPGLRKIPINAFSSFVLTFMLCLLVIVLANVIKKQYGVLNARRSKDN